MRRFHQHYSRIRQALQKQRALTVEECMAILGLSDARYVKNLLKAFEKLADDLYFDGRKITLETRTEQVKLDIWGESKYG